MAKRSEEPIFPRPTVKNASLRRAGATRDAGHFDSHVSVDVSVGFRRSFIDELIVVPYLKLPVPQRFYRMRKDLGFQIAAADHIIFERGAPVAPAKADFIFKHVSIQAVLHRPLSAYTNGPTDSRDVQ
jgi:hypothetical protein